MIVWRRTVLGVASAGALTALLGRPATGTGTTASPAPGAGAGAGAGGVVRLRLTRATNGAATATADRVVAEVQGR
ncbi:hypothetical protein ACFWBI_06020 [Streptomyces sp. NPDC059982]|uniref:hypothetical protein n=1 Tax=unclassified Streptomyces TaxID=2593676 RepID=UPI0036A18B06